MGDHRFLLTLTPGDVDRGGALLHDLAASALERAGFEPAAAGPILDEIDAVMKRHDAGEVRVCEARIRAEAGELVIVLSFAAGGEWRLVRALPD